MESHAKNEEAKYRSRKICFLARRMIIFTCTMIIFTLEIKFSQQELGESFTFQRERDEIVIRRNGESFIFLFTNNGIKRLLFLYFEYVSLVS